MPHIAALHHMFGLGVAEMRTDTYLLAHQRPDWLMVVSGASHFEIRLKAAMELPLSVWTVLMKSSFPLPHSVIRTLQATFPAAELPNRIASPADLLSWVKREAHICTVSKRMVTFRRADFTAELSYIETLGWNGDTFCLTSKRYETVADVLGKIPAMRLPNLDYGSWLRSRLPGPPARAPVETTSKEDRSKSRRAPILASPAAARAR